MSTILKGWLKIWVGPDTVYICIYAYEGHTGTTYLEGNIVNIPTLSLRQIQWYLQWNSILKQA